MSEKLIDGVIWRSGGIEGGRSIDGDDAFEEAFDRLFSVQIADNEALAIELWQALANTTWTSARDGRRYAYSFRAAGDLVAALWGSGDYMDWYCCVVPPGVVSERVAAAMLSEGWTWEKSRL